MMKNNKNEFVQCRETPEISPNSQSKRIYLGKSYPRIYFTEKESLCMYYFMQGMSEALTARAMGLSPRTVNFYSSNMRMKLGCRNRQELIATIRQTDFLEQFLTRL